MNRPFSPTHILIVLKTILPHLGITLGVVAGTVVLGLLLAILLVCQKRSKFWSKLADIYIHITRCTPSIVILFIVFYGIPKLFRAVFNIQIDFWPKIIFVIIALTLLYGAQLAEIIRSSYEAVGKGQFEAGISIGLTPFQTLRRIVIPQAVIYALPNFGNSLIALLKEGSLAYTIGLIDIMGAGNIFIARNYGAYALETYIALAIVYWIMTLIVENGFKLLEKRLSKGRVYAA